MDQAEMIQLIRDGVAAPGGTWAELGAGTGNFTQALATLLGPQATIYAVDRDRRAIEQQQRLCTSTSGPHIVPLAADFTHLLDLPPLDGVLMANALHFVRDQVAVLKRIRGYLKPAGRLLLVEYDFSLPRPWVPFPVSPARFTSLAMKAGFTTPTIVGRRRSPSSGTEMYGAVSVIP